MVNFLFQFWLIFISYMNGIECVNICSTSHWSMNGTTIAGSRSGIAGPALNRLRQPISVLLTNNDTLYVLDSLNYRLLKYPFNSTTGISVISSTLGNQSNQFISMDGMSMDENGHWYIIDGNLSRIIQWIPSVNNGTIIINSSLINGDSFNQPRAMFIEYHPIRIFWIVDTNNHRIVKFINSSSSIQIIGGSYGIEVYQMKYPQGLFVRRNDEVILYIADSENHRILSWRPNSTSGEIIAGLTSYYGSRPDQLWNPTALIVDENQCMFIVDSYNSRIVKWTIGQAFGEVIAGSDQSGTLPSQLNSPFAFVFNSYGALIVADTDNNRIQFFNISCDISNTTTSTTTAVSSNTNAWTESWSKNGTTIAGSTIGDDGSDGILLSHPSDVWIDRNNNIYVLDMDNYRVQMFDSNTSIGVTILQSTEGSSLQQFSMMDAFHVSEDGSIYILDDDNARVTKWSRGGTTGILAAGGNGQGKALNQLKYPLGFVVEEQTSIIWIADTDNCRIVKWISLNNMISVTGNNTCGNRSNQLNFPQGLFLDQSAGNRMYIADTSNNRIHLWIEGEQQGRTVAGLTLIPGNGLQQLDEPVTLIVENNQRMFIVDGGNHRIMAWNIGEDYGEVIAGGDYYGVLSNQLNSPQQIKLDSNRALIVVDYENNRIQKFTFNYPSTTQTTTSSTSTTSSLSSSTTTTTRTSLLTSLAQSTTMMTTNTNNTSPAQSTATITTNTSNNSPAQGTTTMTTATTNSPSARSTTTMTTSTNKNSLTQSITTMTTSTESSSEAIRSVDVQKSLLLIIFLLAQIIFSTICVL